MKDTILWVPSMRFHGNLPAPDTKANLQRALELILERRPQAVLLLGGQFTKGQTEAAAEVMYSWLAERLPSEVLTSTVFLRERESTTTRLNVLKGAEALNESKFPMSQCRHLLVSQRLHMWGFRVLMRHLDLDVKFVSSGYLWIGLLGSQGLISRLLRLPLYLWDPRGEGRLSSLIATRRTRAAAA